MMRVTTATVWVCSTCGNVDRLDGHAGSGANRPPCTGTTGKHTDKPVLVMVPYA